MRSSCPKRAEELMAGPARWDTHDLVHMSLPQTLHLVEEHGVKKYTFLQISSPEQ